MKFVGQTTDRAILRLKMLLASRETIVCLAVLHLGPTSWWETRMPTKMIPFPAGQGMDHGAVKGSDRVDEGEPPVAATCADNRSCGRTCFLSTSGYDDG